MAFFKFRLPGQTNTAAEAVNPSPSESLEVVRKRARHRLMGSVVLVLVAVIGFPLLFDTQPRPVSVDTPITIPERAVANTPAPVPTKAAATSVTGMVKPQEPLSSSAVLDANEELVTPRPPAALRPETAATDANNSGFKVDFGKTAAPVVAEAKPSKSEPAAADKVREEPPKSREDAPKAREEIKPREDSKARDEAAKAKALLEGKDNKSDDRWVIQVGAYTDVAKVKEARQKLESAGMKTYTQVIDSKEGKRTRVRVGPFASKDEADKNAQKIQKLHLETSIFKI
jgi:DedD protein